MERLTRNLFESDFKFKEDISVGTKKRLPERILQFGEGVFLRGFVDYLFDELNSQDLFNGSAVIVQPKETGLVHMLQEQDGLYTLILRGLENGKEVCVKKLVTTVNRGINPYVDYASYIECAKNPELRVIVSNTTEAGIAYDPEDRLENHPQVSFPGKITGFLYERFKYFNGDKTKGFILIPCELIDNNGDKLKEIVLRLSEEWGLGGEFIEWVKTANIFTNTLVDRIVTGYPKDEVDSIISELGYDDRMLDTAEIFHFWVIEGPTHIGNELPFSKSGLNVLFTNDAKPYKMRKVRILNGAHTISVLAAFLTGKNTVGEMMDDPVFNSYIKSALFDEIIPATVKYLAFDDLKAFSDAVFDRFANPFIKHYLINIALNSVSKFKARVMPSVHDFISEKKQLPKILTFAFASLIAFYRGNDIVDGSLIGMRNGEEYKISDDLDILEFFKEVWASCDGSKDGVRVLVEKVCANQGFWDENLNELEGFTVQVTDYLYEILTNTMEAAVSNLMGR